MEPPSFMSTFGNMAAMLVLVLVLMVAVLLLLRKMLSLGSSRRSDDKIIKILAVRPVGPRNSLVLLEVLDNYILIAISNQQVTFLTSLGTEEAGEKLQSIMGMDESRMMTAGIESYGRSISRRLKLWRRSADG